MTTMTTKTAMTTTTPTMVTATRRGQPLAVGLTLALGLIAGGAMAAGRTCTEAESTAADAAIDAIVANKTAAGKDVWPGLHAIFQRYRQCDDGGVGEGISDMVVTQLSRHWDSVADLVQRDAQEPAFGSFILMHIDSTADTGQLAKIKKAAKDHCPAGQQAFCARVGAAATRAIADS